MPDITSLLLTSADLAVLDRVADGALDNGARPELAAATGGAPKPRWPPEADDGPACALRLARGPEDDERAVVYTFPLDEAPPERGRRNAPSPRAPRRSSS